MFDPERALRQGVRGLALALDHPTIADIACYPCVKRAPEGGLLLEPYPAVMTWLARCEAPPGWLKLD